jgi:UDP-N-acetylmuramoyl-tripeptide--D-alanyl-D-alanine ligase
VTKVFSDSQTKNFLKFEGYTSDSRSPLKNKVFIALSGSTVDGHKFVDSNLISQASQVVVNEKWFKEQIIDHPNLKSPKVVPVLDTHAAHRELAKIFRSQFKGKIIGVGGSSGKTTTKEFLFTLLSKKFKCFKTQKSQNGELGIPKTLEQLSNHFEIGIVEIGIDAPSDMLRHCEIVDPDYAVLTSIGEEHLNLLKTIDQVFQEEKILFDWTLKKGGHCFAPVEDKYLSQYQSQPGVTLSSQKNSEKMGFNELNSTIQKQNACLAAEVCLKLGMTISEIQEAAQFLTPPEGRGVISHWGQHILIEDHYNSNPSSLKIALENLQGLKKNYPTHNIALVLGDMLDLGVSTTELHKALKAPIEQIKANSIFLIGPEFSKIAGDLTNVAHTTPRSIDMVQAFTDWVREQKNSYIILFKGSRGMKLEIILNEIKKLR